MDPEQLTGKEKALNKGIATENKFFIDNNPSNKTLQATKTSEFMDKYMGIDAEIIWNPINGGKVFFTGDIKSTTRFSKIPEDIYIENEDYRKTRYILIAYEDAQVSMMPSTFFKTEADYFIVWLQYYNMNYRSGKNELWSGWYFYKYDVMFNLCLYGTPDKPSFQTNEEEHDYIIKRLHTLNSEPKLTDVWLRGGYNRDRTKEKKITSKLFAIPVNLFFDYWTFVNKGPAYLGLWSTNKEKFLHTNKYYRRGKGYNSDVYREYTDILDKNF